MNSGELKSPPVLPIATSCAGAIVRSAQWPEGAIVRIEKKREVDERERFRERVGTRALVRRSVISLIKYEYSTTNEMTPLL